MAHAIEVVDLSKRFRLYNEKYSSMKERVLHGGRMPFTPFWALKDVNVEIDEGETTFGILGPQRQSGKSVDLVEVRGRHPQTDIGRGPGAGQPGRQHVGAGRGHGPRASLVGTTSI